jgi:hypothetical protein
MAEITPKPKAAAGAASFAEVIKNKEVNPPDVNGNSTLASTIPEVVLANAASKANREATFGLGATPNPEPVPGDIWTFYPSRHVQKDTEENAQFITSLRGNNSIRPYFERFEAALAYKKNYDQRVAEFEAKQLEAVKRGLRTDSLPLDRDKVIFPFNREAAWITSFGSDANEIMSNIVMNNERAEFMTQRMINDGIFELIESSPDDFEDNPALFAEYLEANGIFKSKDEKDLFVKHAKNPHSVKFGTSVYDRLMEHWTHSRPDRIERAEWLPPQILSGRKLDYSSPIDVKDFERWEKWARSQKGAGFLNNFVNGLGHLAHHVFNTWDRSIEAVGYPEFEWSERFKNATGEDAELKAKFIYEFNNWRENGYGQRSDNYRIRQFKMTEADRKAMMEFPESLPFSPDAQAERVMALYRKIEERGGISMDTRGLASGLALFDGMLQGTASIYMLFGSTDPNSLMYNAQVQNAKTYLNLVKPEDKANMKAQDVAARMFVMSQSLRLQDKFREWSEDGMVVPSDWYDSQLGFSTSMWADAFLVYGAGKSALTAAFRRSAGKAIAAESMYAIIEGESKAILTNAAYLSRKGIELPQDVKSLIEATRAELEKIAGRKLSDVEILEGVFKGEKAWMNPATNALEAVPESMLKNVEEMIVEHAQNSFSMRRKLAQALAEGRKWDANLSASSKLTMKKAREILKQAEPAVDWSKVSDAQVYQRLRQGIPSVPVGGIPVQPLTKKEVADLISEVGETWRGVKTEGKAGFRGSDNLGIDLMAASFVGQGVSGFFAGFAKGVGGIHEALRRVFRTSGVNPQEVQSIMRPVAHSPNLPGGFGTGMSTGGAYENLSAANLWIGLGALIGDTEQAMWAMFDWFGELRKHQGNNIVASQTLKNRYSEKLTELTNKRELMLTNKSNVKKSEIAALEKEMEITKQRYVIASRYDAVSRFGALRAGVDLSVGTLGTMAFGEAMIWANDTRLAGLPSGFTFGMKGTGMFTSMMHKQFNPTLGVKERANFDLMQIQQTLKTLGEAQQAEVMKVVTQLVDRRNEAYKLPGRGVLKFSPEQLADIEFARGVNLIARLYQSGAEVNWVGENTLSAIVHLSTSTELKTNPELRQRFIDILVEEQNAKGLSGEEAQQYAVKLLNSVEEGNLAKFRLSVIETTKTELNGEKIKLQERVKKLDEMKNALRVIISEAGIAPERVGVANINVDVNGKPTEQTIIQSVTIDGKPLSSFPEINQKIAGKFIAWKESLTDVIKGLQNDNARLVEIDNELLKLDEEAGPLMKLSEVTPYSDRLITGLADGSFVIARKGITIWEAPVYDPETGLTIVKPRIYINPKHFLERTFVPEIDPATGKLSGPVRYGGYETVYEELAHALHFSQDFREVRVQMNRDILGGWSLDENGNWVEGLYNKEGKLEKSPPGITGNAETNLDLFGKFAKAYADTLSKHAKAEFLARWELGVRNWRQNKGDTRHLQAVIAEVFGQMYVQRHMMSNPQSSRMAYGSAMSSTGTWNTTPSVSENGAFRNWNKFVFGGLNLVDIMMQDRIDLAYLDVNSPDITRVEASIHNIVNFVNYFSPLGFLESFQSVVARKRASGIGLIAKNNDSKNPSQFWEQGVMHDEYGRIINIPVEGRYWVDAAQRGTRGVVGVSVLDDPYSIDRLKKAENSLNEEDRRFAVTYLLATGRKHWLSPRNDPVRLSSPQEKRALTNFKRKFEDLFYMENEIVRDLVGMAVREDRNGDKFGFKIRKNGNSYALFGQPTPEQAGRIIEWIRQQDKLNQSQKGELYAMNQFTFNNTMTMLESLSNASTIHPDAAQPGFNGVFTAEYQAATAGVGPGTTAQVPTSKSSRYVDGTRPLVFTPFMIVIKDSSLNAEGERMFKIGKDGEKQFFSRPQIYAWVVDHEARMERTWASWYGKLADKDGKRYSWSNADMVQLFGTLDRFNEAMNDVYQNYATSKFGDTKETAPEYRTYEVLLEKYAGGNKKVALKMAGIIHRTIGTPDNMWIELKKSERDLLLTTSEKKRENLAEKISELEGKLAEQGFTPSERQEMLADMMAKDRSELGSAPMFDTRQAFTLIRLDRLMGLSRHTLNNQNSVWPISGAAYGWMQIAYSKGDAWQRVDTAGLESIRTQHNLGGVRLTQAWNHPSGYVVWGVQSRVKGKLSGVEYVLLDPLGQAVNDLKGKRAVFKTIDEAFSGASSHSYRNPVSGKPILNNSVEMAMHTAGWVPRGTKLYNGARTSFVDQTGKWELRRSTKGWDLIDVENDTRILANVDVYSREPDKKGKRQLDPAAVQAAADFARTSDIRELVFDEKMIDEYRQKYFSGVSDNEWRKIRQEFFEWQVTERDYAGANKLLRPRFASKNKAYWEFKRHLARTVGLVSSNDITQRMVNELGADKIDILPTDNEAVAAEKTRAVQEWILKFDERAQKEGMFSVWLNELDFDQQKAAEHAAEANRAAEQMRKDRGTTWSKKPVEPTEPRKPFQDEYGTNAEWLQALQDYDVAFERFLKEKADYDLYSQNVSEAEARILEQQSGLENAALYNSFIEATKKQLLEQREKNVPITGQPAGSRDVNAVVNTYVETINKNMQAAQAAVTQTWVNKSGYIIAELMYKDVNVGPGFKVIGPRIGKMPNIQFLVFTPKGILVKKAEQMQEAQEAVLEAEKSGGIRIDFNAARPDLERRATR